MFGLPKKSFLSTCKRENLFVTNKGVPKYCVETTDGSGNVQLTGSYSRRGKFRGIPNSRDLASSINSPPDPQMIDFLRRCLDVNPDDRMTPSEALHHEWLRRRLRQHQQSVNGVPVTGGPTAVRSAVLGPSSKPIQLIKTGQHR